MAIIDGYLGTLIDDIELGQRLKVRSNGYQLCLNSPVSTSRSALVDPQLTFAPRI